MDAKLQELLDKQSIYEVLVRYCRGADRCDEAIIRSVYHDPLTTTTDIGVGVDMSSRAFSQID